jgi:phospholipid-binding lipoprotein MlaA
LSALLLPAAMLLAGMPAGPAASIEATPLMIAMQAAQPVQTVPPAEGQGAPPPQVPPAGDAAAPPETPAPNPDDIIVNARKPSPADPLERANVQSFKAVQAVDRAVVGPVAMAYKEGLPPPIRSGLRNVIGNLSEPVVFLNFLLQLKPGKAAETLGRFAVNSTIGVAGLFDVAKRKPFHLPHRNNGFAYTLGYYGVKPGPFLFLPLIGPTTLRDVVGRTMDLFVLPVAVGKPFNQPAFALGVGALKSLDDRAEFDEQLHKLRDESPDGYVAIREAYLKQRQAEIDALHGRHPAAQTPPCPQTAPAPEAAPPAAVPDAVPQPEAAPPSVSGTAAAPAPEPLPCH